MNLRFTFLLALITFVPAAFSQEKAANTIKKDNSVKDMKYLSSDALEGRRTGSAGNTAAAEYISKSAREIGLRPLPGQKDMFQKLDYLKVSLKPDSSLLTVTDTSGNAFQTDKVQPLMVPLDKIDISGDIVFAGYGYVNNAEKYNDFSGLSLSDKIVMIMTRTPDLQGTGLPSSGEGISEMEETKKLPMLLFARAKAILYVADPALTDPSDMNILPVSNRYQLIPMFKFQMFNFSLNAYVITRETADLLLRSSGQTLTSLQNKIAETKKPVSFILPNVKASLNISVQKDTITSSNVVAYIEGSDPVLKDECVIYTAHYDHSGINGSGEILNGANDNASGTVGLLNVARAFSALGKKPLRSIVFLWTTGEEEGLHGSSYYVENPLFPVEKTVANINFDMIGRSKRDTDVGKSISGKIDITGNDTIMIISAKNCSGLLNTAKESCSTFGLYPVDEGKGEHFSGSDHFSFHRKGVPALFFFTGLHQDYHRPTDDFEFIDFEKLVKTSKAGFLTGFKVANTPERPVLDNTGK